MLSHRLPDFGGCLILWVRLFTTKFTLFVMMKTVLFVSFLSVSLLSCADAASLKIVATKLVGTTRHIAYETCGWAPSTIQARTATPSNPPFFGSPWTTSLVSCAPLASTSSYTIICGWVPSFSCQLMECTFPDISGLYGFYVRTPTPNTCDVDVDGIMLTSGGVTALCC